VKTPSRPLILKSTLVVLAILWHVWLSRPSTLVVELLFGVTPYLLLAFAWDFIGRAWIIVPALTVVVWSDVTVGLAVRDNVSRSAMDGVAKLLQLLFACAVVGAATLLALLLPARRKRNSRDPS
jgi:hypothetical protein